MDANQQPPTAAQMVVRELADGEAAALDALVDAALDVESYRFILREALRRLAALESQGRRDREHLAALHEQYRQLHEKHERTVRARAAEREYLMAAGRRVKAQRDEARRERDAALRDRVEGRAA